MNALSDQAALDRLAAWLSNAAGGRAVTVTSVAALSGGAIQENWRVDLRIEGEISGESTLAVVLRCDAASVVAASHGRLQEFALLQAAFAAGVTVPEPLWACDDLSVIGRPFFVMRLVAGTADAQALTKDAKMGGDRKRLAERLGRELALLHTIRPPRPELALPDYEEAPALRLVARNRRYLDTAPVPHPVLEWALRWLEVHAPPRGELVLCHRDFRTGNYMVDESGLTGVLDWEFAGFSDPMEDLGWFCASCWRFARPDLEAGGIGQRTDFYAGYQSVSGAPVDDAQVRYWEVMAHVNWAVIALQQADRHVSGIEPSLLLALTGHIVPELEWALLNMTAEARSAGDGSADVVPAALQSTGRQTASPVARPDGADLLQAARTLFEQQLLPSLQGSQRHAGRMIMRAMDLATRELQAGLQPATEEWQGLIGLQGEGGQSAASLKEALLERNRRLVQSIRDGDADAGMAQHKAVLRHLRSVARSRVAQSNPRLLA